MNTFNLTFNIQYFIFLGNGLRKITKMFPPELTILLKEIREITIAIFEESKIHESVARDIKLYVKQGKVISQRSLGGACERIDENYHTKDEIKIKKR